jgi:hypothetical protein
MLVRLAKKSNMGLHRRPNHQVHPSHIHTMRNLVNQFFDHSKIEKLNVGYQVAIKWETKLIRYTPSSPISVDHNNNTSTSTIYKLIWRAQMSSKVVNPYLWEPSLSSNEFKSSFPPWKLSPQSLNISFIFKWCYARDNVLLFHH